MKKCLNIIFIFCFIQCKLFAAEYLYILNDKCIESLYLKAQAFFQESEIVPIKDSRGIVLRYFFEDPFKEYYNPNIKSYLEIEKFLANIDNPAIIEVHVKNFPSKEFENLKKWEFSTIMANSLEAIITRPKGRIDQTRINSIGYGEFLPLKNTSNNGGNNLNRIDIIILCNITGE